MHAVVLDAPMSVPVIASWVVLALLLLAIAWTDGRTHRIPNGLNAALTMTGLAAAMLPEGPGVIAAIAGIVLGGAFILIVATTFRRLRGQDGLGLGDAKFLAGAGAWTGWQGVGPVVFLAAIMALGWIGLRRLGGAPVARTQPIAFGPFLCLGLLLVRCLVLLNRP